LPAAPIVSTVTSPVAPVAAISLPFPPVALVPPPVAPIEAPLDEPRPRNPASSDPAGADVIARLPDIPRVRGGAVVVVPVGSGRDDDGRCTDSHVYREPRIGVGSARAQRAEQHHQPRHSQHRLLHDRLLRRTDCEHDANFLMRFTARFYAACSL